MRNNTITIAKKKTVNQADEEQANSSLVKLERPDKEV